MFSIIESNGFRILLKIGDSKKSMPSNFVVKLYFLYVWCPVGVISFNNAINCEFMAINCEFIKKPLHKKLCIFVMRHKSFFLENNIWKEMKLKSFSPSAKDLWGIWEGGPIPFNKNSYSNKYLVQCICVS